MSEQHLTNEHHPKPIGQMTIGMLTGLLGGETIHLVVLLTNIDGKLDTLINQLDAIALCQYTVENTRSL